MGTIFLVRIHGRQSRAFALSVSGKKRKIKQNKKVEERKRGGCFRQNRKDVHLKEILELLNYNGISGACSGRYSV